MVRYTDLELTQLLDFQPGGGVIRFAGQRALIMDTVALGFLRRELTETLGATAARGVLTRFGYAHGWRTAETMKSAFPWDTERDWKVAGGRLHMLQGAVTLEPPPGTPEGQVEPFAEARWRDSEEAEQHLISFGRSVEPVCWTLCGFASGYLSRCNEKEIYCIEDACVGCGDTHCHMVGRTREQWGDAIEPHIIHYRQTCLDAALQAVTDSLKRAERELQARRRELADAADGASDPSGMIVRSDAMKKIVDLARRVAKAEATVLVSGESGVGKERIARMIHDESTRARGPFVGVNCGAVSESLLESELFGHAKGAFTGAGHDRVGLFETANGGTLFLDEIGEVSPSLQVKLLRALQEREIRRVGESKTRPIDVRIVAATNRNLAEDVLSGRFRQDLYYRLRVIELHIPPLRERRDDVMALARVMLARAGQRMGKKVAGFSPGAAEAMLNYRWPGNVRELENAIEHAVVLCDGTHVKPEDLPQEVRQRATTPTTQGSVVRPLDEVEREYILGALEANGGNQSRTAGQLRIGTATLYRKLKQYEKQAVETSR